jgi:hypothetical protein
MINKLQNISNSAIKDSKILPKIIADWSQDKSDLKDQNSHHGMFCNVSLRKLRVECVVAGPVERGHCFNF